MGKVGAAWPGESPGSSWLRGRASVARNRCERPPEGSLSAASGAQRRRAERAELRPGERDLRAGGPSASARVCARPLRKPERVRACVCVCARARAAATWKTCGGLLAAQLLLVREEEEDKDASSQSRSRFQVAAAAAAAVASLC